MFHRIIFLLFRVEFHASLTRKALFLTLFSSVLTPTPASMSSIIMLIISFLYKQRALSFFTVFYKNILYHILPFLIFSHYYITLFNRF